jgi:hypothetical protein
MKTKTCQNCGTEFPRPSKTGPASWAARKFCNLTCAGEHRGRMQQQHLHSEVAWIMHHDHPESVARRVGYARVGDLIQSLRRTGAPELADTLARNLDRYTRGGVSYRAREDVESFA